MAQVNTINNSSPVGESKPRIDAREKVTGTVQYTDDLQFGNALLHARIKRSPHPHALIKGIDISKASALPGVKAVVTGQDFLVISGYTSRIVSSFVATVCAMWATRWWEWRPSARRSHKRPST